VDIRELKELVKNMSLLYVEDNKDLSYANMQLFEDIFMHVDLAEDGKSALNLYREKEYDLVITDINMPKMNGLVMLKNIREINNTQAAIVVSAFSEVEYLSKMKELQINHFLTKPINSKHMINTIYRSIKDVETV
jgi:YesN/AraC family two-component response regulator